MVSHTASKEARDRANKIYYQNHKDQLCQLNRKNYYNNPEARQKKLDKARQRLYEEGTIRYIRRLWVE
jgi:hypothetical protein